MNREDWLWITFCAAAGIALGLIIAVQYVAQVGV